MLFRHQLVPALASLLCLPLMGYAMEESTAEPTIFQEEIAVIQAQNDDRAVEQALRKLRDAREDAQSVMPLLIDVYAQTHQRNRYRIVEIINELKGSDAKALLLNALANDPDRDVRRKAAEEAQLWHEDEMVLAALRTALDDPDYRVSTQALSALIRADQPDAMSLAQERFNTSSNIDERASIMYAMRDAQLTGKELMLAGLQDSAGIVRDKAAESLERLRFNDETEAERAVVNAALITALQAESHTSALNRIVGALARHNGFDGQGELVYELSQHQDTHIKRIALPHLAAAGHPEAFTIYQEALQDSNKDIRVAAARGLRHIEAAISVPVLITTLKDQHRDVAQTAVESLAELRSMEALPALAALITPETHKDITSRAIDALRRLEHVDAMPAFAAGIQHGDRGTRERSIDGLRSLNQMVVVPLLITGLQHKDARTHKRAHDALKSVAEFDAGATAEEWQAWYTSQQTDADNETLETSEANGI